MHGRKLRFTQINGTGTCEEHLHDVMAGRGMFPCRKESWGVDRPIFEGVFVWKNHPSKVEDMKSHFCLYLLTFALEKEATVFFLNDILYERMTGSKNKLLGLLPGSPIRTNDIILQSYVCLLRNKPHCVQRGLLPAKCV